MHETTSPCSPKSNGVAKKKNSTLKEMMNVISKFRSILELVGGKLSSSLVIFKIEYPTRRLVRLSMSYGKDIYLTLDT